MAMPISYWSKTIADNTTKSSGEPEVTTFEVPIITLTPANVAATETLTGNLATAIAAVTLGRSIRNTIVYNRAIVGNEPAASTAAQRENKWLCRYHDVTTFQKYRVEIGTADLTKLPDHKEFMDLTAGDGLALKTAFEAVVRSPADASHLVLLDTVQFVGRNS